MTTAKTFDITYPGAVAGVEEAATGGAMKSLEQLVADAGGDLEVIRTVRPTQMKYDYVPVARH